MPYYPIMAHIGLEYGAFPYRGNRVIPDTEKQNNYWF
jgi:hypothetical protein